MRNPKKIKIGNCTLEEILERHQHWIDQDVEGWENMRANLSYTNLYWVNLSGVNLSEANLCCANLIEANLCCANLSEANLSEANLCFANLSEANLSEANLSEANLCFANLCFANLCEAKLTGANLNRTILCEADLDEKEQIRKGIILTEPMKGFKKCRNEVIVELEIPVGAIVFSINNEKCRTNKAIVKAIYGEDGNEAVRAFSMHKYMTYYVGDTFNIKNFNMRYSLECATGIHFFRTEKEAKEYM